MRLLLSPDPADPASPPAQPAAPASPTVVQKTPVKHPAVIALEKKVAGLEDEVSTVKGWMDDVNATLEGLNVGGPPKPAPVKVKAGNVPTPTPTPTPPARKSFGQTVDEDIWGTSSKD